MKCVKCNGTHFKFIKFEDDKRWYECLKCGKLLFVSIYRGDWYKVFKNRPKK